MMELTPEALRWLLQFFVRNMNGENAITLRVVRACPPEKLCYRPDGLPLSFAEVVQQIYADGLQFLSVALATNSWGHSALTNCESLDKSTLIQACTDRHNAIVNGFQSLTDEQLKRDVSFNAEHFPAILMADWYVVNMVHHRGMMCTYLRLLHVDVPRVYVS